MGVQWLQRDRPLLAQRDFERRQAATQAAIHSLQLSLTDAKRHLLEDPVPDGMVRFVLTANGIQAQPADRVLWLPGPRETPLTDDGQFAAAERLEFQADGVVALVDVK